MPQRVDWSPAAEQDLRRLDQRGRERVRAAVYRLADTGQGDVRRLRGREQEWRLRVGDRRVLFTYDPDPDTNADIFLILRVLPRGQAYRD